MPQNNEIAAALPSSGAADKELLREWAVKRNAFCLRPEEDLRDFNMIDPDGGGTTPAAIQNGLIYSHDEADTTTAHDGVTCLVSADAQRYKLEAGLHSPFNVLDKDLTAPPVSPSVGDAFLIYGSPTGAWAGKAGYIAILTARGYSFALPPIGFLVFVRDEGSYYFRNNLGVWTLGTGTRTLGANSVVLSNAVNFGKRVIVENQTTNTVPVSPSVGDAYICGPSWPGGNAGKVAICEDGSTFTIYTPRNGWAAYDKSQSAEYRYNGTAWVSSAGAWLRYATTGLTASPSNTTFSGTSYSYSATTAPTTANNFTLDATTQLAFTARRVGAPIRLTYRATVQAATTTFSICLYRDNETTAIDWTMIQVPNSALGFVQIFELTAADTNAHTYKIRITYGAATFSRSQMSIEEGA